MHGLVDGEAALVVLLDLALDPVVGASEDDIDRVLIPKDKLATRIQQLAQQITADHTDASGAVCSS